MNRTYLRTCATPLAALLLVGLAGIAPPTALAAQPPERAAATVYAGGVDFRPNVSYSGATLTVSGNDLLFQRTLGAREGLSIGVFDPEGQLLPDGVYTWSLDLVPSEVDAKRLRAEAAANGGTALEPWAAQSGSFTIRGSVIADPTLAEAGQQSAAGTSGGATFTASSFGSDRRAAQDDDGAVGSRAGAEAQINATASRQVPAASDGVLLQPNRAALDDSDAISATIGGTLERAAAANDNQLSAQSRGALAPRPRSDGSNGRPRSDR